MQTRRTLEAAFGVSAWVRLAGARSRGLLVVEFAPACLFQVFAFGVRVSSSPERVNIRKIGIRFIESFGSGKAPAVPAGAPPPHSQRKSRPPRSTERRKTPTSPDGPCRAAFFVFFGWRRSPAPSTQSSASTCWRRFKGRGGWADRSRRSRRNGSSPPGNRQWRPPPPGQCSCAAGGEADS